MPILINAQTLEQIKYKIDSELRKSRANMYGTIAAILSPSLLFYFGCPKDDKAGRAYFGAMVGVATASMGMCLANSKRKHVARNTLFILSGAMDAFNQELLFHYPRVKSKFGITNDQWFDPSISWQNKYTSNVPLAGTLLVGTTDAYHASRSLNKALMITGVIYFDRDKNFWNQLKQVALCSFLYTTSKGLTHQLINLN
jgi:hypothetical protein